MRYYEIYPECLLNFKFFRVDFLFGLIFEDLLDKGHLGFINVYFRSRSDVMMVSRDVALRETLFCLSRYLLLDPSSQLTLDFAFIIKLLHLLIKLSLVVLGNFNFFFKPELWYYAPNLLLFFQKVQGCLIGFFGFDGSLHKEFETFVGVS